ncbi:HNH endonuclease [Roseateles depolymerans]|uniref:HNH endonuclease n=1 Tax=Roseateles depolymerans TaxID=76731 RepID=A0A0U3D4T9_9BURK|nr:HNH endonuclease [Roseateles depolymerans]ALV08614.1 HNH endonuclease [Roseateles depolymerans]REG21160.1 5-methylcytosine-specific restriction protein A [Roseateles depolymerans]
MAQVNADSYVLRFELNRVYDRWPEINDPFGGSRQSGIAPSRRAPAVFLFTGESGEQYGYKDHFDENGVFSYTGEGQVGDMKMTNGNLAIARHAQDGRSLHVFKALGKGKGQQYKGEFIYANHTCPIGPDRNGDPRKLIVFHLLPVRTLEEDAVLPVEVAAGYVQPKSLQEARSRALAALKPREGLGGMHALRAVYERSRAVRDYVLLRAAGVCESCDRPAPFVRADGSPYLEPHHITRLSDGGLDHPSCVAALCPACHREIHYGDQGSAKNAALKQRTEQREAEGA